MLQPPSPPYLPLVGVPSTLRVARAIAHKVITGRRWGGYCDGWPERQADFARRRPPLAPSRSVSMGAELAGRGPAG